MMEEKHRGHDLMHAEMFLILFSSIMVAQILLFLWRKKHTRSYQVAIEYNTVVYWSVLDNTVVYWSVLDSTVVYWSVLDSTVVYWNII